jgi:hypothetical protein
VACNRGRGGRRVRLGALTATGAIAALGLPAVAFAASGAGRVPGPVASVKVYACYSDSTDELSYLNYPKVKTCAPGETLIFWNVPGPQGARGAQGATGPRGATGALGRPGAQGKAGPAGAQGATGARGAPGTQGAAGPQGLMGATGPRGARGVQGALGATGTRGAAGRAGTRGATGPLGPYSAPF